MCQPRFEGTCPGQACGFEVVRAPALLFPLPLVTLLCRMPEAAGDRWALLPPILSLHRDTEGPRTATCGRDRGKGVSRVTRGPSPPSSRCPGRAEAGEPHRAQKSREPRTGERAGRRPASPGLPAAPEQCSGTGLLPTISGPACALRGCWAVCPVSPTARCSGSRLSGPQGGACREVALLATPVRGEFLKHQC